MTVHNTSLHPTTHDDQNPSIEAALGCFSHPRDLLTCQTISLHGARLHRAVLLGKKPKAISRFKSGKLHITLHRFP